MKRESIIWKRVDVVARIVEQLVGFVLVTTRLRTWVCVQIGEWDK